jgi:hypothetical protein
MIGVVGHIDQNSHLSHSQVVNLDDCHSKDTTT